MEVIFKEFIPVIVAAVVYLVGLIAFDLLYKPGKKKTKKA